LREEMRRVMRYLGWQAEWWKQRITPRAGLDRGIEAGIHAYALKQATWHTRLAAFFHTKWNMSAVTPPREAGDAGLQTTRSRSRVNFLVVNNAWSAFRSVG
jgi:hypothetical protein